MEHFSYIGFSFFKLLFNCSKKRWNILYYFAFLKTLNTKIREPGSGVKFTVRTYATIVLCIFSHIFTTVIVIDLDFHSTKRALQFCPRKHQDSRENKTNCLTIHTICIMYNTLLPQLQGHQNHLLESSSISLAVNFHQVKP